MDSPITDLSAEIPEGPDRPDPRPTIRIEWAIVTWPLLVGVAWILWLRWRGAEHPLLLALVGLTPALAAPLLLATVGAWRSRSPVLRVALAALALWFLVAVNPIGAVVGCGAADHDEGAITLYTANVLFGGGRPADVASSVLAAGSDVFLLQEVSYEFLQELRADPRLEPYRHRSDDVAPDGLGRAIWSRWPLSDVRVEPFVTSETVSATVESPQGSFRLVNVHTLAPVTRANVPSWQAQFDLLETVPTNTPTVLAGDFNATEHHREFRRLRSGDWTDVHQVRGCGFDATWPVGRLTPFPVYRLDHVLVTDHFEVLDLRTGDPGGSDHLPLVAELRLTPPRLGSRAVEAAS